MDFVDLFVRATGHAPYPYQRNLATTDRLPEVLIAPTGAGKTAAVVLGWLYRRRFAQGGTPASTPRRLILCLPMRTLVSQAAENARQWLDRLGLLARAPGDLDHVGVTVLMGGAHDNEWALYPEQDLVIVGTQDMLLSRALNRGYALSRFRWPWHYALVSNDCLWVFDEVQLMGAGLTTGLQLAAFRDQFGTFGPAASLFMSATLDIAWLRTVDHAEPGAGAILTLGPEDLANQALVRRRTAVKRLERSPVRVGAKIDAVGIAREVLKHHQAGTRTLVVVNTVQRAVALADALGDAGRSLHLVLLHSRFRPKDREAALADALAPRFDGVVVSTQVIEAGVDITSRTLITELAPWAALVQRAGRCNRAGEYDDAKVVWLDHEDVENTAAPYSAGDLTVARTALTRLTNASPAALEAAEVTLEAARARQTLRRKDLLDLFDTTPDLGGLDLDVSPFIRDGDERDVHVCWRVLPEDGPGEDEPEPRREELCAVPSYELSAWVKEGHAAWTWDHVARLWRSVWSTQILPGAVFIVPANEGGYLDRRGWSPKSSRPVAPITAAAGDQAAEALDDDPLAAACDVFVLLRDHLEAVGQECNALLTALSLPAVPTRTIVAAARLHDIGKAHDVFQETMRRLGAPDETVFWAKAPGHGRHSRPGFRHELAGALVWLLHGDETDRDLVSYLIAAHHGKVRLSIRSLPNDLSPPEPDRLHARGVWDGEVLPAVDAGNGGALGPSLISLAPMQLGLANGQPSWLERMLKQREHHGPFRLAYLEMLVTVADWRASRARGAR